MTDKPVVLTAGESAELLALAEQIGRVGVIDFTNPQAAQVYKDYLSRLFKAGAAQGVCTTLRRVVAAFVAEPASSLARRGAARRSCSALIR